ncbi:MAG: PilT/PilU family type 4a pilus ATPase, partial [Polyangiaceae bacterium]
SGKVDVARAIVWLLRSRDPDVRRIAVEAAKKAGDPNGELAQKLLRYLRDEDWWVRERVMDALVEMAGSTLTKHLVTFLQDPSDVVRRFAIGGLSRGKDPRAIGALVRAALEDTDWWVREQAVEVVGELKDVRAIPHLLEVLKRHPSEKLVCIQALTKLRASDAAPRFAEMLSDEDPEVRLSVVQGLGEIDARAHAPALKACEDDKDFKVRTAVQELIARWNLVSEATRSSGEEVLGVLDRLLVEMAKRGGDDLMLGSGRTPYIRHLNKVVPLGRTVFTAEQTRSVLFVHLTPTQVAKIAKGEDVDFSYEIKAHNLRFRGHVFQDGRGLAAVFRIVKNTIVDIDVLGLPPVVRTFGNLKNGLVLVGGPTGSGKSTTLAALVNHINQTSAHHIVTIEDPIEVVHKNNKSLISQREVGTHTSSFAVALRSTLRQDPDVILVGELRDLATIAFAVSAAETGHLVLGTVHTASADMTVDRLINAFPGAQQPQVRSMLADTLRVVVCQHLLRLASGAGRTIAVEVM